MTVPAAGGCSSDTSTQVDSFCGFLRDHGVNDAVLNILGRVLWPIVLFLVVILIARLVRHWVRRAMQRSDADVQVTTLVHNVLLLSGYVIALGVAFVAAGLNVGVVLTLGGATSIVLGLALQDLLRNVIAGTFILIERPFRIGDVVTVDTVTGSVQSISLRTTLLRLADGQQAVIPNLLVFSNRVVNITAFDRRQFSVSVWVPLDIDIETVLKGARAELEAIPELAADPPPRVQPDVQIDGGVTLNCQYWLDYREVDADAIAARLVRRVARVVEDVQAGRAPETPPAAPRTGGGIQTEGAPSRRVRRARSPLRRRRAEPEPPSADDTPTS